MSQKLNLEELLKKPAAELTPKEMEAVLKHSKQKEAEQREKDKTEYESKKDEDMQTLYELAQKAAEILHKLKAKTHRILEEHQEQLNQYGSIRSNSKGGFTLLNSNKDVKIRRRRDTQPVWDERSKKATELLHEFLFDTVKKRDAKLFEILIGFLSKNKKGDLEYSSVMNLLNHKDKFDDPRWVEGLQLLQESYTTNLKGWQYDFEVLNPTTKKYERLELNFSAL